MLRARIFARCTVCTHAAIVREGARSRSEGQDADVEPQRGGRVMAPCAMCGGKVAAAEAPADLFSEWRCKCYQCVATPC